MLKSLKRPHNILLFLLPTLVCFSIAFIAPFVMGVGLSFTNFTTITDAKFVGGENYAVAFTHDGEFLQALGFTALFTLVSVITINIIAFILAMLLTKGIKGTNLFRSIYFLPNLIGGIVLGYVWNLLLNGMFGCIGVDLTYKPEYGFWGLVLLTN